jgi:nucleoside-diphosphate-sugar epimerase
MNNFNKLKEKEYDVTNFEWTKVIDIAKIIADIFEGCTINVSEKTDELQKNALREPSVEILKYWQPKTSVRNGIIDIINQWGSLE